MFTLKRDGDGGEHYVQGVSTLEINTKRFDYFLAQPEGKLRILGLNKALTL